MSRGNRSIAKSFSPVIAPAIARIIPAAADAVTKPASAPVRRQITSEALLCKSSSSTNSGAISAIALIASGTIIDAPNPVIVPQTLMMGRSPSRVRIGTSREFWREDVMTLNP